MQLALWRFSPKPKLAQQTVLTYKLSSIKGSVQRKLRPMLLYIIWKLFSRRRTAAHLNFCLLKGHFTKKGLRTTLITTGRSQTCVLRQKSSSFCCSDTLVSKSWVILFCDTFAFKKDFIFSCYVFRPKYKFHSFQTLALFLKKCLWKKLKAGIPLQGFFQALEGGMLNIPASLKRTA